MKTHTTLLMLAFSVAPLYAQQAAPAPAAQVFTALAEQPAHGGMAATPEQRAVVFNALALLPQEVSDFTVATKVGQNVLRLAQSGACPEIKPDSLPAELLALDNIALATTKASPATYKGLAKAIEYSRTVTAAMELALNWSLGAHPEAASIIMNETRQVTSAQGHAAAAHLQGIHLPPSYLVLTCEPGQEEVLKSWYDAFMGQVADVDEPWLTPVQNVNGFSGAHIEPGNRKDADEDVDAAANTPYADFEKALRQESNKRHLYVLARLQGNALILATCENPDELKLAASPGESVLSTNLLTAADGKLDKGVLGLTYISKELLAMNKTIHDDYALNLAAIMSKVFTKLGEKDIPNQTTYNKATIGIEVLAGQYKQLTSHGITQPTTILAWSDGDLHLTLNCDAQGCSFHPNALRLAALADAPQTAFYAEMTPLHLGTPLPDFHAMAEAGMDAAAAVTLTLAENNKAQAEGAIATVRNFAPELQAMAAAAGSMAYGLDGHVAFVLDAVHAPLPGIIGAQPGTEAELPRFSLYAGVQNRGQLSSGWEALLTAVGQAAGKLGTSPGVVNMLPITPTHMGNATSYSVSLPFFTPDFVPSLTISDKGLALGSSARFNAQLVQAATGNTPFAGSAFAFRIAPFARSLRSLAIALDPTPEEAEPAANSRIRLEANDDEAVRAYAAMNQPDSPTATVLAAKEARLQRASDDLSTAATIFEQAAKVADGVYGTSTIANGTYTLHVKVDMKD